MKYKNRKLRLPALLLIGLIVIVLGFGSVFAVSKVISPYPKELTKKNKTDKDAGSYKIYKKTINEDYYVLHYPKTGSKDLDNWIQETMDNTVVKYTDAFSDKAEEEKHAIKQDYVSKHSYKRYTSVKLKTYVDDALVAVESKTYDTKEKKFLTLDFFNREGLRLINHELRTTDIKEELSRSQFLKETDLLSAYENFIIDDADLNIETTYLNYSVDLSDKGSYLNEDFGKIKKENAVLPSVYLDYGFEEKEKMVAFTFDDGPYSVNSSKILEKLDKYDAKGTFFILGQRIEGEEASLKIILDTGHQLASHSYDHPDFNALSVEEIDAQLKKTDKAIFDATGYDGNLYVRPPYGNLTEDKKLALKYTFTNWSVDTNDWLYRDADKICATTVDEAYDGAIILMHELYEETVASLDCILPKLTAQGYKMVTTKELLEAKGNDVKFGQLYYDAN